MTILKLYADCLVKTFRALERTSWTVLLPMAYLIVLAILGSLLGRIPIIGGLLVTLATTAVMASFLYVVAEMVRESRVRPRELRDSFKPFFWPIMNVLFVLWIASLIGGPLLSRAPNGAAILLGIYAVLFVLLNAVPESIYVKGSYGGLAAIQTSIQFIQQNWLEWFIPNIAFGAALYFGNRWWSAQFFGLPMTVVVAAVAGALVHVAMVFRGFLFEALDGTTARQRELRYRLGR